MQTINTSATFPSQKPDFVQDFCSTANVSAPHSPSLNTSAQEDQITEFEENRTVSSIFSAPASKDLLD